VLLLLLRSLGLRLNHLLLWVRDVVFPHVLHQVRLLQWKNGMRGGHDVRKNPSQQGGTRQLEGLLPLDPEELLPGMSAPFCYPPGQQTLTEV